MSFTSGPRIPGKRAFSAAMISRVSSTLSVVCVTYASFVESAGRNVPTSSTLSTRWTTPDTCPIVPSTSGCPWCPMRTIS